MAIRADVEHAAIVVMSVLLMGIPTAAVARDLSLEERGEAERAIQRVYWSHRVWPEQNAGVKPPFEGVVNERAIRARVERTLRASALLDTFWRLPVTGEALQAEMDRMARDSKAPEVLRELFAALHDDPGLIAESLARPAVAWNRASSLFAGDERIHGAQRASLEARLRGVGDLASLARLDGQKAEFTIGSDQGEAWSGLIDQLSRGFQIAPDRVLGGVPVGRVSRLVDLGERFAVMAVRQKSPGRLTVVTVSWPKRDLDSWLREAIPEAPANARIAPPARGYVLPAVAGVGCANDVWALSTLTSASGFYVPAARQKHTALWTGAEMIVWGGWGGPGVTFANGGAYLPAEDRWAESTLTTGSGLNVPEARYDHTAIWTGTGMIVWGGLDSGGAPLNNGGWYDPLNDTWILKSLNSASGLYVPGARHLHTALWTGDEMIVWGGSSGGVSGALKSGGRYDPVSDTWAVSNLTNGVGSYVPAARTDHTAVWTGASGRMIVWGGLDALGTPLDDGGVYDKASDTWILSKLTDATGTYVPAARHLHSAVWTGSEMIVWGGLGADGTARNDGGRYDPVGDQWRLSSLTNATGFYVPFARGGHTAVWTGAEMIVWGGSEGGDSSVKNTGGRYRPVTDTWLLSSLTQATGTNVPDARQYHTAIWTGDSDHRMIVWGGSPSTATGGLYCAVCSLVTWYRDLDADGYGDAGATATSCVQPAGYVIDATDCNDGNATVHPGASETCNGVDDDCDGVDDDGGGALCSDGNACTADVCGGSAGCTGHANANVAPTGFSSSRVDGRDLEMLAAAWGSCSIDPDPNRWDPLVDFDASGCVGDTDFHLFMSTFGHGCP